ncbi:TetR/AcrR family transcriptional regulator [Nocardia sp. NBC_01388]|uniref:TetR/AcrR family transcriptional regulator n=1 Tax=Nocardia sp. NBC_01388 TaxID=2903596 RepID=UPI00324D57D4
MARKSASAPTDDSIETGAESKAVRTRKRILDAAAYVLSRKGYAGTRLSEVAEIAELQAPAIYYYFPSKDDLVEEVMWAGIADMNVHVGGVLAEVPAEVRPIDRILVAVEAHMRHELEISDYTTASIRNAGQVPEKIRVRQLEEEAKYGKMWRALFDDAVAAGELRSGLDPVIARMLVLGALNWAAEWWTPERGSLDTVVRTAQDIVRNGLSPGR